MTEEDETNYKDINGRPIRQGYYLDTKTGDLVYVERLICEGMEMGFHVLYWEKMGNMPL